MSGGGVPRARAILAERRAAAAPGPWEVRGGVTPYVMAPGAVMVCDDFEPIDRGTADAALIALATAPEVLDALDAPLALAENIIAAGGTGEKLDAVHRTARSIAAAIITANERIPA